jgi:hypothetical protein
MVMICGIMLIGCTGKGSAKEKATEETKKVEDTKEETQGEDSQDTATADTDNNQGESKDIEALLGGHEIAIEGSAVVGSYTTTSGCKVELGSNGSYRWAEPDGAFLKGNYKLYEGTPGEGGEFVMESKTGKLYTLFVKYDMTAGAALEENQVEPAMEFSIFVYDTYTDNSFMVTDLINNIYFEATRN